MRRILLICLSVAACLAVGCDSPEAPTQAEDLDAIPNRHKRPIVEGDNSTLLWANEDEAGNVEWFDMTDGLIDPRRFQFGIGADRIPSVDEPIFVAANDPLLAERTVTGATRVLGVTLNGVSKAYPVKLMDGHEVVNDDFDGEPYAVLW